MWWLIADGEFDKPHEWQNLCLVDGRYVYSVKSLHLYIEYTRMLLHVILLSSDSVLPAYFSVTMWSVITLVPKDLSR